MIWHYAPTKKVIPFVIVVQQRILHKLGKSVLTHKTLPVAFVLILLNKRKSFLYFKSSPYLKSSQITCFAMHNLSHSAKVWTPYSILLLPFWVMNHRVGKLSSDIACFQSEANSSDNGRWWDNEFLACVVFYPQAWKPAFLFFAGVEACIPFSSRRRGSLRT